MLQHQLQKRVWGEISNLNQSSAETRMIIGDLQELTSYQEKFAILKATPFHTINLKIC